MTNFSICFFKSRQLVTSIDCTAQHYGVHMRRPIEFFELVSALSSGVNGVRFALLPVQLNIFLIFQPLPHFSPLTREHGERSRDILRVELRKRTVRNLIDDTLLSRHRCLRNYML